MSARTRPSAKTERNLHWLASALWFTAFPAFLIMGWQDSVPLLLGISVYANLVGHLSGAQSAQSEMQVDEQAAQAAKRSA